MSFYLKFDWIGFWLSKPQNWIKCYVFPLDSMLEVLRFNSKSSLEVETKCGVSYWGLNLVQNFDLGPRTPKLQVLHELCRIWFLIFSPRRASFAWARLRFSNFFGRGSILPASLGRVLVAWAKVFKFALARRIRLGEIADFKLLHFVFQNYSKLLMVVKDTSKSLIECRSFLMRNDLFNNSSFTYW